MEAIQLPPLADGETYVGAIGDQKGNLHHVILLPGDNDEASQQAQIEWAASIGGVLPNKVEGAMLYERCRDQFKDEWYWLGEDYTHNSAAAFCQSFYSGGQGSFRKGSELRARAVRRLPI